MVPAGLNFERGAFCTVYAMNVKQTVHVRELIRQELTVRDALEKVCVAYAHKAAWMSGGGKICSKTSRSASKFSRILQRNTTTTSPGPADHLVVRAFFLHILSHFFPCTITFFCLWYFFNFGSHVLSFFFVCDLSPLRRHLIFHR